MDLNMDWTFRVGDILTAGSILIGGIGFALKIGGDISSLKSTEGQNAASITELKHAISSLSETTVKIAVQDERMKGFERSLNDNVRFIEAVRDALKHDISEIKDDVRVLQHPGG